MCIRDRHDTFGDDASCIIVDERGELVLSHIYDGFDETAVNLLRQEVMPVEKMPDDNISICLLYTSRCV